MPREKILEENVTHQGNPSATNFTHTHMYKHTHTQTHTHTHTHRVRAATLIVDDVSVRKIALKEQSRNQSNPHNAMSFITTATLPATCSNERYFIN